MTEHRARRDEFIAAALKFRANSRSANSGQKNRDLPEVDEVTALVIPGYNVLLMLRLAGAGVFAALALFASGCSGGESRPAAAAQTKLTTCPQTWKAGWQRLANRLHTTVYCPTWMPSPLDGTIGGDWEDIHSVDRDGSYLISFLSHDQSGDVHVNFRGYPGRAVVPKCPAPVGHGTTPCFSNPVAHLSANGIRATVYQVNQGADQWHILYAWRHAGSLYTVSQHVAEPLTYAMVKRDLRRILHNLVLVSPTPA